MDGRFRIISLTCLAISTGNNGTTCANFSFCDIMPFYFGEYSNWAMNNPGSEKIDVKPILFIYLFIGRVAMPDLKKKKKKKNCNELVVNYTRGCRQLIECCRHNSFFSFFFFFKN